MLLQRAEIARQGSALQGEGYTAVASKEPTRPLSDAYQPLVHNAGTLRDSPLFSTCVHPAPPTMGVQTLLKSPWSWTALGSLSVQQAIYASSSLWLLRAVEAVRAGGALGPYLGLYLGTFILPKIPQAIFAASSDRWKRAVTHAYHETIIEQNRGKTSLWANKELGSDVTAMFTTEGEKVLNGAVDSLSQTTVVALNALFNGLALSALVDPWIAATMVGAGLFATACLAAQRRRQTALQVDGQAAGVALTAYGSGFWDNVAVGNSANLNTWKQKFSQMFNGYSRASDKAIDFASLSNLGTSIGCAVPAVAILGRKVGQQFAAGAGAAVIGETLGTFPRIFYGIEAVQELVTYGSYWPLLHGQLDAIAKRAAPVSTLSNAHAGIRPSALSLTHNGAEIAVLDVVGNPDLLLNPGRWTLRGQNFSGKSTLLGAFKEHFGDRAMLLPAHHRLDFGLSPGSTGETMVKTFGVLDRRDKPPIVMLDEWDANLDARNRRVLSSMLDAWAVTHSVIEVIHDHRKG